MRKTSPESVSLMDMAWCLLNSEGVLWRAAELTLASVGLSYEATLEEKPMTTNGPFYAPTQCT